jgi:hypothetical protein
MGDSKENEVQWWLAETDGYGNPTLSDGPHSDRDGVEQAAYLIKRLGMTRGRTFAAARVELSAVTPAAHGANEDALSTLNSIGLRPDNTSGDSDG